MMGAKVDDKGMQRSGALPRGHPSQRERSEIHLILLRLYLGRQ